MTNPNYPIDPSAAEDAEDDTGNPACVIVFNASDPSGAAGLGSSAPSTLPFPRGSSSRSIERRRSEGSTPSTMSEP